LDVFKPLQNLGAAPTWKELQAAGSFAVSKLIDALLGAGFGKRYADAGFPAPRVQEDLWTGTEAGYDEGEDFAVPLYIPE
jgi:hypothetical protein